MAIKSIIAIMTVMAIQTIIYLFGIEPGIECKELVLGSFRGTVHVSLINAEVAKTVTSLLRYLCLSLA